MIKRRLVPTCLAGLILIMMMLNGRGETVKEYNLKTPKDYQHTNILYNNLPGSFQTPCIRWAEPFVLGKLRILIILPAKAAREGIELQERLSSDVSMITIKDHENWGGPEAKFYSLIPDGDKITSVARMKLSPYNRYDAIIIGKVKWTVIPEDIRRLILTRVKGGAGLVIIDPWEVDPEILKTLSPEGKPGELMKQIERSVPLSSLPLDVDFEKTFSENYPPRRIGPLEIRTGNLGEGNVVILDYRDMYYKNKALIKGGGSWAYSIGLNDISLTPYLQDDPLFYDYYFSILAKVLLNVAGKDTDIQVTSETQHKTVKRTKLPCTVVTFKVSSKYQDDYEYQFYYEIRDRRNKIIQHGEKTVSVGKTPVNFTPEIPVLKQGLYMVDLWVKRWGKILGWASTSLTVTDTKYIEKIIPDKEYFKRDEEITGSVEFKTKPEGLNVVVELWDTYHRLIQVISLDSNNHFKFHKINYPLSRTYKILVEVKEKQEVIDEAESWIGLPSSTIDDFQYIMWAGGLNQRKSKTTMEQCKRFGVTGYYDLVTWFQEDLVRQSAANLARNNLIANPYCYGLWSFCIAEKKEHPKFGHGKLKNTIKNLTDNVYPPKIKAYKPYGVMAYSICEENYIGKKEHHWNNPEALRDYHLYLKERYGDIDRLNEIWGSSYKGFSEIAVIDFMKAKTEGKFSQWFEQERHKMTRFNDVHEAVCKKIQKLAPGARISFDCIGGMDFDWPRMSKLIRSFTQAPLEYFNKDQKQDLVGNYIGYYHNTMSEYSMRIPPWQCLFRGGTHMQWWPVLFAFTADLSEPMLVFKQCSEEMKEITSGVGKLLMNSKKRLDPIIILWSNESYFAGILNPLDITWEDSFKRFDNLLRRIGLDYQTIDSEYLDNKLRFDEQHRVLILPNCQSISRSQAERIRDFAKAGGLVIADFMPATMDEYLRPYGKKAVSEGKVSSKPCPKCGGKGRFEDGNVWRTCPKCGGTGKIIKGGGIAAQSILEDVFDFSRKGVKPCGKGYGLFLKGFPDKKDEWGGIRKLLITCGGIKSDIDILDKLGNVRTDVRTYIFDNGREKLLGILPDMMIAEPPGQEIIVKLKEKAHVYNVRANRYLGFVNQLRVGIEPMTAKLLALCPERINGIKLSIPQKIYRPGDVIDLKISVLPESLKDSAFVVRIQVNDGNRTVDCFTKNIVIHGEGVYHLPLALNQSPGNYVVKAVEIISGNTATVNFKVENKPDSKFLGIF